MIRRCATQLIVLGLCMAVGCGGAGGGSASGSGGVGGNTQTSGELEVLETVPARSETEAETDADLSVLFSEPLLERSVTSGSVTLDSVGGSVSGAVSLAGEDTAVFAPEKRLALMTDYTATLHGIEGLSGERLEADYRWQFTTRDGRWGSEEVLSGSPDRHGNAGIAIGPGGEAMAVWIRGGATAEIWANRYAPEGGWGTPERIDAAEAREATSPQLAIDAAGNVVASWGQTDGASDAGVWANRFTPTAGWGRAARCTRCQILRGGTCADPCRGSRRHSVRGVGG